MFVGGDDAEFPDGSGAAPAPNRVNPVRQWRIGHASKLAAAAAAP